ncbi:MAG: hypothetical protein IKL98_02795, partial [Akkermansia sp.]|nr:hypothetical protein [Akkermansia sp.]
TFYWWHAFIINVGLKSNTPIVFPPQLPICEGSRVFIDSRFVNLFFIDNEGINAIDTINREKTWEEE